VINVSIAVSGAPTDQTITIADLSIAHAAANLHLVGVSFTVAGSNTIGTASGTFDTSVAGIGAVQLALGVKTALTVDALTTRFRPQSGTLTLTATNFSVDVQYGAGDVVTLRVDNGKDGTIDAPARPPFAELDSLLTTP
jgi:hypothetical protein